MKKMLSCCLIAVMAAFFRVGALNAATSVSLSTTATVSASSPELTVILKQIDDGDPDQNPWTGSTDVTSMTLGPLIHIFDDGTDAGIWFAKRFFAAMIFTQSFGKPYNINSSSTGLTFGTTPLEPKAFVLAPGYAAEDRFNGADPLSEQGPMPTGASLGKKDSAVGTDKLVYSSESGTTVKGRILRAFYGVPPKNADGTDPYSGWVGVPLSQAPGSYSGTVTLTITLK